MCVSVESKVLRLIFLFKNKQNSGAFFGSFEESQTVVLHAFVVVVIGVCYCCCFFLGVNCYSRFCCCGFGGGAHHKQILMLLNSSAADPLQFFSAFYARWFVLLAVLAPLFRFVSRLSYFVFFTHSSYALVPLFFLEFSCTRKDDVLLKYSLFFF